jgi:hypothetical protein
LGMTSVVDDRRYQALFAGCTLQLVHFYGRDKRTEPSELIWPTYELEELKEAHESRQEL